MRTYVVLSIAIVSIGALIALGSQNERVVSAFAPAAPAPLVEVAETPALTPVAAPVGLEALRLWVGKHEIEGREGQSVWDEPALQKLARETLTPEVYDLVFNQYAKQVTAPLEQKGDVLFAFACKAHACNSDQVKLFVDLKKGRLAACVGQDSDVLETWHQTGQKPRQLAEPGCAEVDAFLIYETHGKD